MKLLVMADEESKFIWDHFDPEAFRGVEMVISCGDLKADYLSFVATMLPVPLFYVPGNHDKRFKTEPPEGCISVDGEVQTFKGIRLAGLGGCLSQNPDAVFEYTEKAMNLRANKLAKKIQKAKGLDILVTHAPSRGLGDGDDGYHKGFAAFIELMDMFRPKLHVFGHQHKRYSYSVETPENYNDTMLINACGYKIVEI